MISFFSLLILFAVGITNSEAEVNCSDSKVGVLFMHGWTGSAKDPYSQQFKDYVQNETGVPVELIDLFNGKTWSTLPLDAQVEAAKWVVGMMAMKYDKVIAVGHSQGGVIWRGIIENWIHLFPFNVDTFIPLASPQHGIITIPSYLLDDYINTNVTDPIIDKIFANNPAYRFTAKILVHEGVKKALEYIRENLTLKVLIDAERDNTGITRAVLTAVIEDLLYASPLNYYMDSANYDLYLKNIHFFPDLNNERGSNATKEWRKNNFIQLRRLVMIGGPHDGIVVPWQSELFGFFDDKGYTKDEENILSMNQTRFYKEDLFGLKTLDENHAITMHTVPNVNHFEFLGKKEVLLKYVVPVIEEVKSKYCS